MRVICNYSLSDSYRGAFSVQQQKFIKFLKEIHEEERIYGNIVKAYS